MVATKLHHHCSPTHYFQEYESKTVEGEILYIYFVIQVGTKYFIQFFILSRD